MNKLLSSTMRTLSGAFSPAGENARLTVVTFHRVLDLEDPLQPELPTRAEFEKKLSWLADQFEILPLAMACERLYSGTLPQRSACITFDDGYRDNLSNALPALRLLNLPATLFVASGFQCGSNMFNDEIVESVRATRLVLVDASAFGLGELQLGTTKEKLQSITALIGAVKYLSLAERKSALQRLRDLLKTPETPRLMLSAQDVLKLHRSEMTIGGHTRNHPILMRETDETAFHEIQSCRDDLKDILGITPELFAFPNGKLDDDFTHKHCEMVKRAGFRYGFSTDPASANRHSDPFRLPRVSMWANSHVRNGLSLLNNLRKLPN